MSPVHSTEIQKSRQMTANASPGRYYIRPDDTLLGISLRLGINVGAVRFFSSTRLE
jgi:hypothetical protein